MNGQKLEELQRTPKKILIDMKCVKEGHTFNKFGSPLTITPYIEWVRQGAWEYSVWGSV